MNALACLGVGVDIIVLMHPRSRHLHLEGWQQEEQVPRIRSSYMFIIAK